MKKQLLDQILKKKENKNEFAIVTNIANGESCIFEKNKPLDKNFEKYSNQINNNFDKKKNGIIENTDIFCRNIYQAHQSYNCWSSSYSSVLS